MYQVSAVHFPSHVSARQNLQDAAVEKNQFFLLFFKILFIYYFYFLMKVIITTLFTSEVHSMQR